MPLLELSHVAAQRGNRPLFHGLSLRVQPTHLLHLRGPNGVGKTTLLQQMAGFRQPSQGHIHRDQEALFLGAHNGLRHSLSLQENLLFWFENSSTLEEALHFWQLTAQRHLPLTQLSRGQLQRGHLARLRGRPHALWLLDEPLHGLDAHGQKLFWQEAQRHLKEGGAVVMASHSLPHLPHFSLNLGDAP